MVAIMPEQDGWMERERELFQAQVAKGDPWVEPEPFAVDSKVSGSGYSVLL